MYYTRIENSVSRTAELHPGGSAPIDREEVSQQIIALQENNGQLAKGLPKGCYQSDTSNCCTIILELVGVKKKNRTSSGGREDT